MWPTHKPLISISFRCGLHVVIDAMMNSLAQFVHSHSMNVTHFNSTCRVISNF